MKRFQPTFLELASGLRLHYRLQGPAAAPCLVLLNGLLSDTTMWSGALPHLTAHFRVLTYDMRGQGRTGAPSPVVEASGYPVALHAADAREVIRRLDLQRPWLVGLSNGANVALELLSDQPGAFAGGVLTSSLRRIDFTTRLRIQHWMQCLETGGPLLQFDAVAPYLWGDRFLEKRHAVLRHYHQARAEVAGEEGRERRGGIAGEYGGLMCQMAGILNWDMGDRLASIRDPLLLLCGAEDLLTPPWKCLETAQALPHARFEVVPGVGHAYPVEDPKAFAIRVSEFVRHLK